MNSEKMKAAWAGGVVCALLVTVLSLIPALAPSQLIEIIAVCILGCVVCLANVLFGLIAVRHYLDNQAKKKGWLELNHLSLSETL